MSGALSPSQCLQQMRRVPDDAPSAADLARDDADWEDEQAARRALVLKQMVDRNRVHA